MILHVINSGKGCFSYQRRTSNSLIQPITFLKTSSCPFLLGHLPSTWFRVFRVHTSLAEPIPGRDSTWYNIITFTVMFQTIYRFFCFFKFDCLLFLLQMNTNIAKSFSLNWHWEKRMKVTLVSNQRNRWTKQLNTRQLTLPCRCSVNG